MATRKAHEVASALMRKGFRLREGDHHWYEFCVDGELANIRTKISHGDNECDSYILGRMAQQVHLTSKQFRDLVDCPMTERNYKSLMEEAGRI